MIAYAVFIIIATIITSLLIYGYKTLKEAHNTIVYNLFDQTRTYGILVDNNHKITRISNAMCELLEVQHFELIGKHVSYIFNEKDRHQINTLLKNIDYSNLEVIDNITIKTKTKTSHVLCKLAKVDGLLHFHHKTFIFQDRTSIINSLKKLEKSEAQLKEYADLLQSSFKDSFLPAVIVGQECRIENYNKSFQSLVKKSDINTQKDLICEVLNIEHNLLESKMNNNKCFEISCTLGNRTKDLVFNTHKITHSDGKQFTLCQIQDITKQKQAETIRKKLENKIIQTRKVEYLGELSGLISHEFNNALMPILSFSKSVEKSLPDDMSEEKEKLQKVIQASNHAKKMISQIMEIKHIDFHNTESINLNQFLDHNLTHAQIPENIKVNINNSLINPTTQANFEVLSKSFQNAIKNSCQAMADDGGEIFINMYDATFSEDENIPKSVNQAVITKDKTYYAFEIKDTGKGISDEDIENIFNPFFTTKHFNKQIGTGLTYVYNCMEKFNIPLCIKATPKGGVSLTAFFPQA